MSLNVSKKNSIFNKFHQFSNFLQRAVLNMMSMPKNMK